MKIAIASDLHLEHAPLERFDHRDADAIVLAGDIHTAPLALREFVATLPAAIPKIVILGNHEYDGWSEPALAFAQPLYGAAIESLPNAFLLERGRCDLGKVTILGATLWSDFRRGKDIEDSRYITKTIADPKELIVIHRATLAWLKTETQAAHAKKQTVVVATHMAPSYRSFASDEMKEPLAGFFASNLDSFIRELRPKLWIHGHIHTSLEYTLGATTIVANPRGYPGEKFTAVGRQWSPKIVTV